MNRKVCRGSIKLTLILYARVVYPYHYLPYVLYKSCNSDKCMDFQCPSVGRPPLDMSPRTIFPREFCPPRHYLLGDFVPLGRCSLMNNVPLSEFCPPWYVWHEALIIIQSMHEHCACTRQSHTCLVSWFLPKTRALTPRATCIYLQTIFFFNIDDDLYLLTSPVVCFIRSTDQAICLHLTTSDPRLHTDRKAHSWLASYPGHGLDTRLTPDTKTCSSSQSSLLVFRTPGGLAINS